MGKFKMKGFNPGKGTGMSSSFSKTTKVPDPKKYIPGHEYNEKGELVWVGSGKDPDTIKYDPTSYDKQEDRPLYQRDYMNVEGRADLPGTYYQSPSSWSSYGSKEFRDHSKHDAYSGVKDKAAGYDEYSLGAKGLEMNLLQKK